MNVYRTSSLAFALATVLSLSACHSKTPATADNTQPSANPNTAQTSPQSQTTPPQTQAAAPAKPSPAPPPPPAAVELPSGTQIRVRLDQDLSSKTSQPGDPFQATVADDVTVDGTTVIPRGARASGTVMDAKALGRFKGGAVLAVRLDTVHTRWGSYPVQTGSISRAEQGKGKRSATMIGGGAGLGALIGGLAGGGKGAAIGALAGGGAGTAGSAFTGNKQIVLPAETLLTFRLQRSVHITESGRDDSAGDPQLQPR